jgi:hypothetical protein
VLLAGDAAHQMPPFAGQGMCSGMRDALTLCWQLDLVLRGLAEESALDAYTSERRGHLQHAIAISVELGKVICISDEAEAAARDEALLALAADSSAPAIEPPVPDLGPGVHHGGGADSETRGAGRLFPQASVPIEGGGERLLEDTIDGGFVLYVLDADPADLLDADTAGYLRELETSFVALDARLDPRGVYRAWFDAHGCSVALVRPDFYVFATASTAEQTRELVRGLRSSLTKPAIREETPSR